MSNITIFFDALGRTIIGEQVGLPHGRTSGGLRIKNPAVLHAGLNNEGKIQVNLIPAFFREFQKDWNVPFVFEYNYENITLGYDIDLQDALAKQYESMWAPRPDRETTRKIARELTPSEQTPPAPTEVKKLDLFAEVKADA